MCRRRSLHVIDLGEQVVDSVTEPRCAAFFLGWVLGGIRAALNPKPLNPKPLKPAVSRSSAILGLGLSGVWVWSCVGLQYLDPKIQKYVE